MAGFDYWHFHDAAGREGLPYGGAGFDTEPCLVRVGEDVKERHDHDSDHPPRLRNML